MAPRLQVPRGWTFASIPTGVIESNLSTYAKLTVAAVLFHSWNGGVAFPGIARLAALCSCSPRKAQDAVQELEAAGWLTVERGRGKVNRYEFVDISTNLSTGNPPTETTAPRAVVETEVRHHMPPTTAPHAVLSAKPRHHVPSNEKDISTNKITTVRAFTDWWTKSYPTNYGQPYHFAGVKDAQAAKKLVDYFIKAKGGDEAAALATLQEVVENNWRNGWASKDKFIGSSIKTISGFNYVLNRLDLKLSSKEEGGYHQERFQA